MAQNIKSPSAMQETGLISCSGRVPGEGHDNPLQHSCLENFMDGGPGGLQSMGLQSST